MLKGQKYIDPSTPRHKKPKDGPYEKKHAEIKRTENQQESEKTKQKDGTHRRKKTKLQKRTANQQNRTKQSKRGKIEITRERTEKRTDPKNPGTTAILDRKKVVIQTTNQQIGTTKNPLYPENTFQENETNMFCGQNRSTKDKDKTNKDV